MARKMALAGVDPSELLPPPPPEKPHTFREKWDNFWYHYKKLFWVVTAVAALLLLLVVQVFNKNPADYNVIVVTDYALPPMQIEALESYLALAGDDLDADGKIEVDVENIVPRFSADGTSNIGLADQQALLKYIASGEKMIYVFDSVSYEAFNTDIAQVISEDYRFFASLDIADSGYDAEGGYWCWKGDSRVETYELTDLPEEMFFGVRAPEGTADSGKSYTLYEQGKLLIERLAKKEGN